MRFESSVAERVYNEWLKEFPIKIFLAHRLSEIQGVKKNTAVIEEILCENGVTFKAKVFIDATYEGDVLHAAGVSTYIGRESNATYKETLNGIRAETTQAQFSVRVDPYRIPGDSTSGVIPPIFDEPLGTPGDGDHRLQAYCFHVLQ